MRAGEPRPPDNLPFIRRLTRTNLLLSGAEVAIDAALTYLREWFAAPLYLCALPGPLTLPDSATGSLLLRDVAALDHEQQHTLLEWLDAAAGGIQVISATSADLFAAVTRGLFSEKLYYRLNTVVLDLTRSSATADAI